jgi:predicted RNA polymerase sigma factor
MAADNVHARVTEVARASWGRLIALIAARTGDIAAAEDYLSEAFARALKLWPEQGIPANAEAWLLTVARNLRKDQLKSAARRLSTPLDPETFNVPGLEEDPDVIPDERLKLMFACAHPAIDEAVRTPLMLQSVLGLEAAHIAGVFLVAPAAMAQRLVRAKQKIKLAGVPFTLPGRSDMPARMAAVLEAVYGVYAVHWGDAATGGDLGGEARFLAGLLADLMPDEPEALGLAALIRHLEARRAARRSPQGAYVPLDRQDVALWRRDDIERAERMLRRAQAFKAIGRFQLEAAIQSVHADRLRSGRTDWPAIVQLYEALLRIAPSVGAAVGLAAALGPAQGPAAGLACLDAFADQIGEAFQPAHAVRARLLADAGRHDEARSFFGRAAALARDPAVSAFLEAESQALGD